ncbi:hypothetical protein C8J57DRAFT_1459633 [Mycena rebaudengoi]|nr:hypothetical protein C8J57DRAFT_1459633 [Mycena rebaudengoi]
MTVWERTSQIAGPMRYAPGPRNTASSHASDIAAVAPSSLPSFHQLDSDSFADELDAESTIGATFSPLGPSLGDYDLPDDVPFLDLGPDSYDRVPKLGCHKSLDRDYRTHTDKLKPSSRYSCYTFLTPKLIPSSCQAAPLPCARWTTVTSRRQLFKILLDSRVFKHLKSPQVFNLKASNPSRSSSSYFPYSAHRSSPPPRTAFKPAALRDRVLAPKLPPRSSSPTQAPAARSHARTASPCLQSICQSMRYTTMHPVLRSPLPALDGWVPEAQAAWIV